MQAARHTPPPDEGPDLSRLVQDHAVGVWRFLRLLGCPEHEAEDVCQEVFLLAMQKDLAGLNARQLGAFLRRSAAYIFSRQRRRERRRREILAGLTEQLWQDYAIDDQGEAMLQALRDCIEELPPRSREAIALRYGEGRGRAEVARRLGIGAHGAKSMLQRLRQSLRNCMERRIKS